MASACIHDSSLAVLLLNAFTRHEGGPYLRQTLQPAIVPLLDDSSGYEIDPRLLPANEGTSPVTCRASRPSWTHIGQVDVLQTLRGIGRGWWRRSRG